MFLATANTGLIAARLVAITDAGATWFADVAQAQKWLSAQLDADLGPSLPGGGFSTADIAKIRSAFADQDALRQVYGGAALPGTYTLPYNFSASSAQLIGPG